MFSVTRVHFVSVFCVCASLHDGKTALTDIYSKAKGRSFEIDTKARAVFSETLNSLSGLTRVRKYEFKQRKIFLIISKMNEFVCHYIPVPPHRHKFNIVVIHYQHHILIIILVFNLSLLSAAAALSSSISSVCSRVSNNYDSILGCTSTLCYRFDLDRGLS